MDDFFMKSHPRVINVTFRSLTALIVLLSWVTGEVARAVPDRWGVEEFTRKLNPHQVVKESFSAAVITSLLFNPESEEGRGGYKIEETEQGRQVTLETPQIILRPWFRRIAPHSHHLTSHHPLFSQPEMAQEVSSGVRDLMCRLSYDIVVLRWLEGVKEPLSRSQVIRFTEVLEKMQTVLSGPDTYTHQALFRLVYPAVTFLYEQPIFDPHKSMEETCHAQQIDPRDTQLKDHRNHKLTLANLVGKSLETTTSTDTFRAQDYAREVLRGRDLRHLSGDIGKTYFEAASAFPWTPEDINGFHQSWRDKASSFLRFNPADGGRFVRFCCLLGVDPKTTPLLQQAATSLHIGTMANLKTLLDFGAEVSKEPMLLQHCLDRRVQARSSEEVSLLSFVISFLVDKGHNWFLALPSHPQLFSLLEKDFALGEALQHLGKQNMLFGWDLLWNTLFARNPSLPNHVQLQTGGGEYGMPKALYRQLYPHTTFDPLERNRQSVDDVTHGRRLVGFLYADASKIRGLCFKQFPEFPGIEYAVHALGKRLFGTPLTPPGRLARIGNDVFWVSLFVPGPTLQEVLERNPDPQELKNLDPQRFGELVILSILTNPEDGRPPNYIVTTSDRDPKLQKIVGIDNDHSMGSVCFQKFAAGLFKTTEIKGSCALFCLDQMNNKIDESIRETFLKLDLKELFGGWIADLKRGQEHCEKLFNPPEAQGLFQQHEVTLDFPIPVVWMQHLYAKLLRMQQSIAADVDKELTYLQLLVSCEPSVGGRYQAVHQTLKLASGAPKARIEATDNRRMSTVSGRVYRREVLGIPEETGTLTPRERRVLFFGSIDDILKEIQLLHTTQELEFQKEAQAFEKRSAAEQELMIATLSRDPQRTLIGGVAGAQISLPSFATMSDSEQKKWLDLIQGKGKQDIAQLSLAHCRVLNNGNLAYMPLQNLRVVRLINCPQITKDGIVILAQRARGLQELTLQNLPNVRKLVIKPLVGKDLPIPFPNLTVLTLGTLSALESLHIDAPHLRKLRMTGCSRLQDLGGRSGDLKELMLPHLSQIPKKELLEEVRTLAVYQALLSVTPEGRNIILSAMRGITLTILDLTGKQIADSAIQALAYALETNKTLATMILTYNRIGDSGAAALANTLAINTRLTTMDLFGNEVGDSGARVLAHALETNTTLMILKLGHNRIGDAGAATLAHTLEANKTLQEIDLFRNKLGASAAQAFACTLGINNTLTAMSLPRNKIGDSGAVALANALETNTTLKEIALWLNQISASGAVALAHALETNTTLTTLQLSNNEIGPVGAQAFARSLEANKGVSLTIMELGWNKIGDSGAGALARALATNTTLTIMQLQENSIGVSGVRDFAHALEANKTLTETALWGNEVGDSGAIALARSLEVNKTLKKIHLGPTKIGDVGAEALAHALETNTTLMTMDLRANPIGDVGAEALAHALETNTTLMEITLLFNEIGAGLQEQIYSSCKRNKQLTEERARQPTIASLSASTPSVHAASPGTQSLSPHERTTLPRAAPPEVLDILYKDYGSISETSPGKAPTFLSLQGNVQNIRDLEILEDALHNFIYTDKQERTRWATLQKVFKGFSGSGGAGALALMLFQQHNPKPTSSEAMQTLRHGDLEESESCIAETMRPFVMTVADSEGNSVTPYDYRRAQEDEIHNISVGELTRRLSRAPASDGSLALYRYVRGPERPLFVFFGASQNTRETLAAIRERGDHAVFVDRGTDIPQLANVLCARAGLTRMADSIPDPLAERFDEEIVRVNQLLSESLTQFYEGLPQGGAAGGVPSPEETRAAQTEIRQILDGNEKREREAAESRPYTALRKGKELQHKFLGHSVSFQDTFEERVAREHQRHITALQEAYSENAFSHLQAYREWKRQVWVGTLKCQLQKAFCTYSALALGTVARKQDLIDYLRNGGLSLAGVVLPKILAKVTENLPIPGISTLASVINTADGMRRDYVLKEHCNKITSLWGQEGLEEMASLSTIVAQELGRRIDDSVINTLTVESLQRLAFLSVDQIIAYVAQNTEATLSLEDLRTAPFAERREWLGSFVDGWTELSQESPGAPDLQAWPLLQKNSLEEAQGGARAGAADLMHRGRRRVGT